MTFAWSYSTEKKNPFQSQTDSFINSKEHCVKGILIIHQKEKEPEMNIESMPDLSESVSLLANKYVFKLITKKKPLAQYKTISFAFSATARCDDEWIHSISRRCHYYVCRSCKNWLQIILATVNRSGLCHHTGSSCSVHRHCLYLFNELEVISWKSAAIFELFTSYNSK